MKRGERVSWLAVNGPRSGVLEAKKEKGYLVRLDNGQCVIVARRSIFENELHQNLQEHNEVGVV